MRTDSTQSPFVAKAHFFNESKWLGRYETFWFQSSNLVKQGANHSQQWQALKNYIDKAVVNKTHELVIFDNRNKFVSNSQNPTAKGVNIVCQYVNGQLINDNIAKLSFMDWTFDVKYLNRLSQMFSNDKHNIEGELHIESETLREKIYSEQWRDAFQNYKKVQDLNSLLKVKL